MASNQQGESPLQPKRDREADRARFNDHDFNRWLDEGISDAGHTVWDQVGNVVDAWHGWQNRPFYGKPHALPLTDDEISALWDRHVAPVFGKSGINPSVFARAIECAPRHQINLETKRPRDDQKRACLRCMWWRPVNSVAGYCKRMPPTRLDGESEGFWPMTGRGDWCGEFICATP